MSKYEEIRRQTVNKDWTAQIIADATIDDLSSADEVILLPTHEGSIAMEPHRSKIKFWP